MSDLRDPSRESLAAIVTGLVERHGGPTRVAAMVDVDRTAIHRWMNGDVSIHRLALLAERLNEPVVVRFGPGTEKDPRPEWAGAMEDRLVQELEKNRSLIEALAPTDIQDAAERVIARLEALGPPGDGAQNGSDGEEVLGGAGPPDLARGSRPDRVPE